MSLTLRTRARWAGAAVILAAAPAAADRGPPAHPATATTPLLRPSPAAGSEPAADEAGVLAPAVVEILPSPQRLRWFGRASLGAVYRWAFDESMVGGMLEGELGGRDAQFAGGLRLRLEVGKMVAGLPYQVVSVGPFLWLPLVGERVRVGFGLDAGALLISRRTMPSSTLWSGLIGGQARLSIDLIHIGLSSTLQADAGLAVQALTAAPGPLTVVTTAGVGYRL